MNETENRTIALFTNPVTDRAYFGKIDAVLDARVIDGRLWLEIKVSDTSLPEPYLKELTCTARLTLADGQNVEAKGAVEFVTDQRDGHICVGTEPLTPDCGAERAEIRQIRIESCNGMTYEQACGRRAENDRL